MRIGIVGASGAGLYTSIFLKKNHPDWTIEVFDRADKTGKKLLATGNGHCNLMNKKATPADYDHPDFAEWVFGQIPVFGLFDFLAGIGVQTMEIGDLVYPLSFSAASYVFYLTSLAKSLGVVFHLGVTVRDYKAGLNCSLLTDQGTFSFDRLVFATGGKSQKNLGSDGSLFPVFERHGYSVTPLRPGLCPVVAKEATKSLQGLRHDAKVTLLQNGKTIHKESGEVLFKNDGISGIVIFNAQFEIMKRFEQGLFEFEIDLFEGRSEEEITSEILFAKKQNPGGYLASFLQEALAKYLCKKAGISDEKAANEQDIARFAYEAKHLRFTYDRSYPFDSSQVTLGGIALSELGMPFGSKREPRVYFVGEVLDIAGRCGGFNLTLCLASSLALAKWLH